MLASLFQNTPWDWRNVKKITTLLLSAVRDGGWGTIYELLRFSGGIGFRTADIGLTLLFLVVIFGHHMFYFNEELLPLVKTVLNFIDSSPFSSRKVRKSCHNTFCSTLNSVPLSISSKRIQKPSKVRKSQFITHCFSKILPILILWTVKYCLAMLDQAFQRLKRQSWANKRFDSIGRLKSGREWHWTLWGRLMDVHSKSFENLHLIWFLWVRNSQLTREFCFIAKKLLEATSFFINVSSMLNSFRGIK